MWSSAEAAFRHQGEEKMEGKRGRKNSRWQSRNGRAFSLKGWGKHTLIAYSVVI